MAILSLLFRYRFAIFFVTLTILLWGIFRPTPPPDIFTHSDKYMHLIAFFGFSLAARFAFIQQNGVLIWLNLMITAPLLEYLQHFFQNQRQFSLEDALANFLGVMLALLIWKLFAKNLALRIASVHRKNRM